MSLSRYLLSSISFQSLGKSCHRFISVRLQETIGAESRSSETSQTPARQVGRPPCDSDLHFCTSHPRSGAAAEYHYLFDFRAHARSPYSWKVGCCSLDRSWRSRVAPPTHSCSAGGVGVVYNTCRVLEAFVAREAWSNFYRQ